MYGQGGSGGGSGGGEKSIGKRKKVPPLKNTREKNHPPQ